MRYEQGDIVLIPFPFTDLSQTKKRPALVISNSTANQSGDYLLMQITSKYSADLCVKILLADYEEERLPIQSFVRINKIFCLNGSLIEKKISSVTAGFSKRITQEIIAIIKR